MLASMTLPVQSTPNKANCKDADWQPQDAIAPLDLSEQQFRRRAFPGEARAGRVNVCFVWTIRAQV
jgi:hypothetical protein